MTYVRIGTSNYYYAHSLEIGVYTFAALNGSESYDTIKDGFQPVIKEINDVIAESKVVINENVLELKIFLCAVNNMHYKVTLISLYSFCF